MRRIPGTVYLNIIDRSEFDGLYELSWETGMLSPYFYLITAKKLVGRIGLTPPFYKAESSGVIRILLIYVRIIRLSGILRG